jgi:hypothetical protein
MMGLLLILVTMFMPGGLLGAVKAASARLSERGAAGPVEEGRSHAR